MFSHTTIVLWADAAIHSICCHKPLSGYIIRVVRLVKRYDDSDKYKKKLFSFLSKFLSKKNICYICIRYLRKPKKAAEKNVKSGCEKTRKAVLMKVKIGVGSWVEK